MRPRELTFSLRPEVQRELEQALGLKGECKVTVTPTSIPRAYGTYTPAARWIKLNLRVESFTNSRLLAVTREVVITLLHEYRHAYQYDHWTPKQLADKETLEQDAERWAVQNAARWLRIGHVKPKRVYSPMRGLSKAEARVR